MRMKNVEDIYPLSPMQEGILFHTRHDPVFAMYFEIITWLMRGEVNIPAFGRAWQRVVDRHQVLRTVFVWEGLDEPLQVVRQRAKLTLAYHDWRGISAERQEEMVMQFYAEERERGFDLAKAPLMRVALIQMGEDSYRFVWSYYHGLVDGWSGSLILNDVFAAYEGLCRGVEIPLPPPRPFRHYIDWLQRQDLPEAHDYWRRTLKGFRAATSIRIGGGDTAAPRRGEMFAPEETRSYREQQFNLPGEATAELVRLSRRHQLTLNTVCQGAWALLLSCYSGDQDVVFGVAVSGRPPALEHVETTIGMFINTLPARVAVAPERTFIPWLKEIQNAQVEMRRYEYSPLVEVQGLSDVIRSTPLFESIVSFENHPIDHSLLGRSDKVELNDVVHYHTATGYPINLIIEPGSELVVKILYDFGRFDDAAVGLILGHLCRLLTAIAADPHRRLWELPVLTEAEERQLLIEWNDTAVPYDTEVALHRFIEEQVGRTPTAVAVSSGGEQVSYEELNRRANQLARRLRSVGAGRESLVGVLMERSIEMVVALLGVLKAGAAYVPLDPSYPPARLAFMLNDAGVPVLLTQQSLLRDLPEHAAQVICLDAGDELESESGENLSDGAAASNLAYVIYTSGSTGKPKGAMNTHRGIVNRLLWMQDAYGLSASDSVLQKTPFSFDVSVWEFFWPLMIGARLVMARPGGHQDAAYLTEVIEEERITTLHFVPSMLQAFLTKGEAARGSWLKRVICSGEALGYELQERFHAQLPGVELHNLYGPTEAAVDVTYWACERGGGRRSVPIGRPIANTGIYILDREQKPVPVGVAGELYIGGEGLGRGYLKRPGLTAERFVPHPFSTEPGGRLYRTGDLARFMAGGEVEFLGRIDHQVKVRGLRIELGEIEAALAEHEAVRECVVVSREDTPGDVRLVAYLVLDGGAGRVASVWRRFLREKLPEYMIPSAFVRLDELPLLPNGKVDRRALPAARGARPELEGEFAAPRNQIEEVLAGVWAEVLGVEQPGIHDNFFDLGGHSLLAAQVVSRIHEAFKVELPLRFVFETPTVAGLAERLSAVIAGGGEPDAHAIERAPREGNPPVSIVQQRLWFLDQLEPGNIAYNIPVAIRLSGLLDVSALERCVGEIVGRHEALRTTFTIVEGQPVQVVAPLEPWRLRVVDLRGLAENSREAEALSLAGEEARRPFDLARGPLLRARLLRLDAEEYMLLLTMHHIVSDGWSIGVFVRELTTLYKAFSNGEASPLPELSIQYADYSQWQWGRLAGELLDNQLSYWKRQLGGGLPVIELPTDRPRPPKTTFRGATEPWSFPSELSEQLKAVGRRRGATLFMTLMSAFQTLLHRYTGLDDVVVGTPIAGRTRVEAEGLIGFFANTLVLRGDLSGDPAFEELLARVREVTLEAHAHQDVPFEMLVEELQPARDLSHTPLFQVMLAMQNAPLPEMRLRGMRVSQIEIDNGTAKFDLILFVRETGKGLEGTWEYNTDCLDRATIRRMAGHFETLLRGVINDPRQRLSELPLLTAPERRQLLVEWNHTGTPYPEAECLHHFFETQARLTPHAIALVCDHERWTYRELNRRANQLSHYLRSLGVGPESLVAVMMERSVELIVAMLGVLKAGGAYVPLDPAYPCERLRFMLEDTRTPVLLTQARLLDQVPAAHNAQVVRLDADWEEIGGGSEADPARSASAKHLAYVIYTSGSTGRPKGVAITHYSAATFIRWAQEVFDPAQLSGVLASTSVCFDLSVFEIFVPLSVGGKVILAANALELPSLAAEEVTLVNTVPSAMAELVRMGGVPSTVRTVNLAGEALQNSLVQRIYELGSVERVLNLYGPSEDTTYSTWALIEKGSERVPPIGRPVANTRLYVLDGALGPVPVGVAGELYIGGCGLARGYLNRPELTAERFVPDLFSEGPGERLYRTGDLVRYLADGEVEYLGRLDHQVKLRGFRIELGEIEAGLCGLLEVQEAVVVSCSRDGAEQRLVGYIVTRPGFAPTTSELRRHLKEQLPEYMIPSAFVMLDEMPQTANGKIDRRALPEPDHASAQLESLYLGPRTPVEEELAGIWSHLLGLVRVGVNDNFFDLGGHSLLATQIVSRVRETFGLELPLRDIFESPTVAGLAVRVKLASGAAEVSAVSRETNGAGDSSTTPLSTEVIEREEFVARVESFRQVKQGLTVPPILPVVRDGALPLSFAQQRLWFLDQLAPGSSSYNIIGGMRLEGELDVAALEQALNEIVHRHEALRTTFTTVDGRPVQVVAAAQPVALTLIDLRVLDEDQRAVRVRELAREELNRPFDLTQGPPLRVSLLRLDDDEHVAVVTMHHIVSDGWSTAIFVKEFVALYETSRAGQATALAPLPIQYADYAHWQREWLQGEALESQLDYWKRTLGGALPVLELPTDRARPEESTLRGEKLFCKLPGELYEALRALSRREGVTLYMTLLAAFQTLLYRYTNQDDLIVGTAIAGRNRAEVEGLIGVFINMLVLRTDLSGNPTFRELMGRVREVTLEAYAHQEIPFEKVVEELQPARVLTQSPLFQVAFGLQHAPVQTFTLPGLKMSPLAFDADISRYDLTLWMFEGEDQLTASWTYSMDLFEAETVARMQRQFETLLHSVVENPEARVGALEVLSEEEKRLSASREREWEESNVKKLMSVKRRSIRQTSDGAN